MLEAVDDETNDDQGKDADVLAVEVPPACAPASPSPACVTPSPPALASHERARVHVGGQPAEGLGGTDGDSTGGIEWRPGFGV